MQFCAQRAYYIESYGCQMNGHDSQKLAGMLENAGYVKASAKANADFIIFNTCCVREHAELRVFGNIGALKKLKDEKPELIIAVCGCMMQQEDVAKRLYKRFPYVDIVFGTHELEHFPEMLEKALSKERVLKLDGAADDIPEGLPILRDNKFSTCVTIMYGCNNFCTYCIVPYVRGRERSRKPEDILNEVRKLAENGYKEIMLLGQNVNSYWHEESKTDFPKLMRLVNDVDGIERIRFMTSHPKDLSDELITVMAECNKVCHHIHLPVQSGNDKILKDMNRRYDRDRYFSLVNKLRAAVKDVEITTDIIVGFPGETDEDFLDTVSLVKQVGFSAAYTFMYSPRKGTKAAVMEAQISADIKKKRLAELNCVIADVLKRDNQRFVGSSGEILVEGYDRRNTPMAYGKLSNFKMVYFPGDESMIGSMRKVKVTKTENNSLIGELIDG